MSATMRFVEGDRKVKEFQVLTIDPDTPHVPQPVDLSIYTAIELEAKQVSPRPANPVGFVPKTFVLTGTVVAPAADGYVAFEFMPTDLDTPGKYLCRIRFIHATERWSCMYDFSLYIRAAF